MNTAWASTLRWLGLVATSLLMSLQGCGPGVGGSGTGQGLDTFGAAAAPLCASDIASALACPAGTGSVNPAADPGTAPVYFADTIDGRRVAVKVQGQTLELLAPCVGIRFQGQWGVLTGQAARFYGFNGEGSSAQPAQVRASLVSGGLQLTVLDASGNTLLGPVLVTARPSATVPGAC